ncbi:hypothetical protein NDU88_000140 [Pleurodeles waltl]|uniref:Uncharacterized protein n=1 Tax=Pleurodeles waltl TaxID=8319 RepID=A0AAV7S7T9_PLEWA|nr:hypothetical protein NDU88_000140 [Pleurodeles waltl]
MEVGRCEEMESPAETVLDKKETEVQEVETAVVVDKGEKSKGKFPVLGANLEVQNERTGETPSVENPSSRVEAQKENNALGQSQTTMVEEVAYTQKSSLIEAVIAKLSEEIKKGFSVSEATKASIREACKILGKKWICWLKEHCEN